MLGVRRMRVWVGPMVAGLAVVLVVAGSSSITGRGSLRDASRVGMTALPRPTSGWVQVSAGVDHSCGVRADGTAWRGAATRTVSWETARSGARGSRFRSARCRLRPGVGNGLGRRRDLDADSAGSMNTCAVRSDHTAWCWGSNRYGQLGTPEVHAGTQSCELGDGGGDHDGLLRAGRVNPQQLVQTLRARCR